MTIKAPFNPSYTTGQTVTPAAAAANISIPADGKQVCLTNLGTNVCYVRIGVGVGLWSATIADYPVPPGAQVIVTKGDGVNILSHISPAGTTLHVMAGEGF